MSVSAAPSSPQSNWQGGGGRLSKLLAALASLSLLIAGLFPYRVPDTFGHLAQGRQIVELGRVPLVDSTSLLEPPRAFYNYEWLSDLLFYGVEQGLGPVALTLLKVAALAGTALVLCQLALRLGGPVAQGWCAVLLVAAIPASRYRFSERPHVLGFLFASATLLLLTILTDAARAGEARRVWRALAALFGLHVLWVNCHGSHLLGLGATVCFLAVATRARRQVAAALLVQVLASCVSPYGPLIVVDAVEHVLDPRYRELVSEWQPWSPDARPWYQIAPALQGGALTLLGPQLARQGGRERALLLLCAGLAVLCFRSMRFVADFLLLSSPLIAAGLATRFPRASDGRALAAAALCAMIGAAWGARALPPGPLFGAGASSQGLPAASGAWLARHMKAPRVFGAMEDTWYLMYAVPQARLYIDGRVPFYGAEFVHHAQLALRTPGLFEQVAGKEALNTVVLRYVWADHRALVQHLSMHPGWQPAVIENDHITFVRAGSVPGQPDLSSLEPVYRYDWVFDAPAERVAHMERALAALTHPNSSAYVAWVRALLTLRPSLRAGSENGLTWPTSAEGKARFRSVLDALARHAQPLAGLRQVSIIEGLVATLLGECRRAEAALREAADRSGGDRTYLMATAELALRESGPGAIADFLAQRGGTQSTDPWVADLARALANPPRCVDAH